MCRKYVRADENILVCPFCGRRLKKNPNTKKRQLRRLYYQTDQGYRCGNCKSLLNKSGDWLECSNEVCAERYYMSEMILGREVYVREAIVYEI